MKEVGAPRHDPVPIGEAATPPFVILPQPARLFARRAERLAALAPGHDLQPYLYFLAGICEAQHRVLDGLPEPEGPSAALIKRARERAMPPLDRHRFAEDQAFAATFDRLLLLYETLDMPDTARIALSRLVAADLATRIGWACAALNDAQTVEAPGEHVFLSAALQVHFARLAAGLDAAALVPVGEGACPACGEPPVSSLVVGWMGAHGTRFCACGLCGTLWNQVRIKCVVCGSTKGIGYEEVEGGPGIVKAETCETCRSYVKIMHEHKNPALDPVADDVATLTLDLLMRESGYRRAAVNPFLLGY